MDRAHEEALDASSLVASLTTRGFDDEGEEYDDYDEGEEYDDYDDLVAAASTHSFSGTSEGRRRLENQNGRLSQRQKIAKMQRRLRQTLQRRKQLRQQLLLSMQGELEGEPGDEAMGLDHHGVGLQYRPGTETRRNDDDATVKLLQARLAALKRRYQSLSGSDPKTRFEASALTQGLSGFRDDGDVTLHGGLDWKKSDGASFDYGATTGMRPILYGKKSAVLFLLPRAICLSQREQFLRTQL